MQLINRRWLLLWQFAVLLLGSSWLLAPFVNHIISNRTGLISQFELPGQPYSWLFRSCDALVAALIVLVGYFYFYAKERSLESVFLLIIGFGLLLDPILSTTCRITNGVCVEYISSAFLFHALETVTTSAFIFILSVYDARGRHKVVSVGFVAFQIAYGVLFLTQLASQERFNTLSQFVYQFAVIVWLAWYVRDRASERVADNVFRKRTGVKNAIAAWAFINGLAAILISLADIDIGGRLRGLYFAGDNAWLAQHGMVTGVILIYISRHLLRGERRARHIFMVISLFEIFKYSVITPHPGLLAVYLLTFISLFVLKEAFDRGPLYMTWRIRLKELLFVTASLVLSAVIILLFLHTDYHKTQIVNRSIDNFFDYVFREDVKRTHLESILLAHALTAFLLSSAGLILWILFRPAKPRQTDAGAEEAQQILRNFSLSSEDYFKIWPQDKTYFFRSGGFIAYKVSGSIAFALADPIGSDAQARAEILNSFIKMCKDHGWRVCFLPISSGGLDTYQEAGLNTFQIGSSAVVKTEEFMESTYNDKWWRWQKNRSKKLNYTYHESLPPHNNNLIEKLRAVSNAWLSKNGREERTFAMGYFDESYLDKCIISYIEQNDKVVAFTNQLPLFGNQARATIDLMRYNPDSKNAMPSLLSGVVASVAEQGFSQFDLGFVPFAATKAPIVRLIKVISSGRFSASGLEQFKNKFDPVWEPIYLAYDGDMADLALIAINIERVMKV